MQPIKPDYQVVVDQAAAQALVRAGAMEQALQVARSIELPREQAEALMKVAEVLAAVGVVERACGVAGEAQQVARGLPDVQHQRWALQEVVKALVRMGAVEQALQVARSIPDTQRRVEALARVAKGLAAVGVVERACGVAGEAQQVARGLPDEEKPWPLVQVVRRLIHDGDLDVVDRAAGLLVLLFAQPPGRITQLATDHVCVEEAKVTLQLGTDPVELPAPLDDLIRQLVRRRQGWAVTTPRDEPGWLFPGGYAGQPLTPQHLTRRLRAVGVPARAARNTTLIDLAAELPSTVVSRLLGVHRHTAGRWHREAGAFAAEYAADLSRRSVR